MNAHPSDIHNHHLAEEIDHIIKDPKHHFILFMDANEKRKEETQHKTGNIDCLYNKVGQPSDILQTHTTYSKSTLALWASPIVAFYMTTIRECDKAVAVDSDHPRFWWM